MYDVFISHASDDKERISPLVKILEDEGFRIWWDDKIKPGELIPEEVENALKNSQCTLVCWSRAALKQGRDWFRAEAEKARARGAAISVLLDNNIELPLPFNIREAVNLSQWSGNSADEIFNLLIEGIKAKVTKTKVTKTKVPPSELGSVNSPKNEDTLLLGATIFINYRRDDSSAITGRIDDRLCKKFQRKNVYRDIDSILLGIDFAKQIQTVLDKCNIFLAVIGKHWMTDRLHDENDFVRMEIEAALKRNIPVIPVLVDGGTLPKKDALPETLRPLLRRNGIAVDSGKMFNAQIQQLIKGIRRCIENSGQARDRDTAVNVPTKIEGAEKAACLIEAPKAVVISQPSGIELVRIPGGEFLMGSPKSEKGRSYDEGPQHKVRVTDFYLGRYPVMNEEYGRFLEANPKVAKPEYWEERQFNQPRQLVVGVSWDDARAYCEWAGLRLPSEAEWEYACRAGTTTRFWSGDTDADLAKVGWYDGNSGGRPHSVGEKEPNPFGLYDMHGNVWEWVEDDRHNSYEGASEDEGAWVDDPRAEDRVFRGGSWSRCAEDCRSAVRFDSLPGYRRNQLGFRPAKSSLKNGVL